MTPGARLPRAILFDWDNTLIDNWPVIHEAYNVTLTSFGKQPWTLDEVRARARASARDFFPILFGEDWREAERIFYAAFTARHLERLAIMPGAAAMLDTLGRHGVYLAVVSNKKGPVLRREADHLGWGRHFARLVGAGDAARDKPAVEPVALALGGSEVEPGPDVWFVGDTDIDMECGHNAGCFTVLLRAAPPGQGELFSHPPHCYLADCASLVDLVDQLAVSSPGVM
jgi:phosphoglycolate phosphatase